MKRRFLTTTAFSLAVAMAGLLTACRLSQAAEWKVDHRYPPMWWQTSICLPDDWQKTLVGKEGTLLYDYPGKYSGFKSRIGIDFGAAAKWERQELHSPRVPVVRTIKQCGAVEVVEEAFAVTQTLPADEKGKTGPAAVERVDAGSANLKWAEPKVPCDPAFADIAVGWNDAIHYRVRAAAGKRYTVVFGLCEGWHSKAGGRVLDLRVEGKTRKTVDMIAEHGKNVPALFPFEAKDENGDGWIDVAVASAAGSEDRNTILNVLWAFEGDAPPVSELLTGRSARPALAHVHCGLEKNRPWPPRRDVVRVTLRNRSSEAVTLTPTATIDSELPVAADAAKNFVQIAGDTTITASGAIKSVAQDNGKTTLKLDAIKIPARGEVSWCLSVLRGVESPKDDQLIRRPEAVARLQQIAEQYWQKVDLPYGHLEVPDGGIQAVLDSSVRNIYQAREIKQGLPAFQVGPTCYRGLWVVDGSFLMESVAFLNRAEEARSGVLYLLGFQRPDGAIMLIDGHLKETGIALWVVTRHARLTNDKAWLAEVWPKIEKGYEFIRTLRAKASDPNSPNYRLMPEGFSDGGLGGVNPEYTNIYWTLAGLKSAIDAARWLGKVEQAEAWQREYDDFYATFRKAAERDTVVDAHGNRCVPISMRKDSKVLPQKAQWAFMHAVFPGKLFALDDPLVLGNMAMLRAVEAEGLVRDTGWVEKGVWNYFGSFYAHGWLWLGQGQKAAQALYDFANHASPLLVWREEQMPVGEGDAVCGDMPHNWASAEFIRLVRHLLVLERGDELHLFEGLPPAWIQPGKCVRVRDVLTEFGPISLELRVAADGKKALLTLNPPTRNRAKAIAVHLNGWSGRTGSLTVPADRASETEIPLEPR